MSDTESIAVLQLVGWPVVKKNGYEIVKMGARSALVPNKRYKAATAGAIGQLQIQWAGRDLIDFPVSAEMHFYLRRAHVADISNLYQAPEDWMEAAGVYTNDGLICHHDGSRRHILCHDCTERPLITRGPNKGQRKHNCGKSKTCNKGKTIIILRRFTEETT